VEAPLALYRRYRPETYAEVIGQDHVTEPLRQALISNRVHHAYLFSGPRGCGKTTSARILARCLNCEKGPTPEPCGSCQSCRDLARGGPGSIDVIEIDAASHGGVDDARELRERAFFAPVAARYKIYIVDEAHMVTTQGFNALLKLVEEPPEHLKFIFATTEPDKVIGTIRSRTHHYPFRLVPPKLLQDYLSDLCTREGVEAEAGALPLVIRAGGGSVRDTLSVLDQLIGGAGAGGLTYAHAVSLLGYTHDSLLDEVVDAIAAGDGAGVFSVIDKVIDSGQDPRRFAEDLLRRLRDLLVVSAVPDAAVRGLLEGPPDQAERLGGQAARFGAAELSRAAEVLNTGLTEMRGATAPRLHLELICARILLPGVDDSDQGVHARLDRVERRLSIAGTGDGPPAGGPVPSTLSGRSQPRQSAEADPASGPVASSDDEASPGSAGTGSSGTGSAGTGSDAPGPGARGSGSRGSAGPEAGVRPTPPSPETSPNVDAPAGPASEARGPDTSWAGETSAAEPATAPAAPSPSGAAEPAESVPGTLNLADVRRLWPDILESVKNARRFTWVMLSQNAQVTGLHAGVLTVGLVNAGARDSFSRSGSDEVLRQALREVLGVDWHIEAVVDPSTGGGQVSGGGPDTAGGPGARGGGPRGASGPGGSGAGGSTPGGSGPDGSAPAGTGPDGWSADNSGSSGAGSGDWGTRGSGGGRSSAGSGVDGSGSGAGGRSGHAAGRGGSGAAGSSRPARGASGGRGVRAGSADAASAGGTSAAAAATAGPSAAFSADATSAGRSAHDPDGDVDPDTDTVLPDSPTSHADLLVREFGAELIEERSVD
jgi:DNA polymerase III subunit gamma/tau